MHVYRLADSIPSLKVLKLAFHNTHFHSCLLSSSLLKQPKFKMAKGILGTGGLLFKICRSLVRERVQNYKKYIYKFLS